MSEARLPIGLGVRLVSVAARLEATERERRALTEERDLLVVRALRRGASEREIARHAGLTGARIHQIKQRDLRSSSRDGTAGPA